MSQDAAPSLPYRLATRLVVDSITYTNPLPAWSTDVEGGYLSRERLVEKRIRAYLDGEKPRPSFAIAVPKKSGAFNTWLVPSVCDQIVLQTCVSALAEKLDRALGPGVFSCRYNDDPNRIQLTAVSVVSWRRFRAETDRLLARHNQVLQLDLASAFPSIQRDSFFRFLQAAAPDSDVVTLLQTLLDSFNQPGIPLMNDSMFFLGNAYLGAVDQIVARYTPTFIRFVDDYRIFGQSASELERAVENISRDLKAIGLALNFSKLKLGSAQEFLQAISKPPDSPKTKVDEANATSGDTMTADFAPAENLVNQVARTLDDPDKYFNEGMGRLILGAICRLQADAALSAARGYNGSMLEAFRRTLYDNTDLSNRILDLIPSYLAKPNEAWRTVWLLYLARELSWNQNLNQRTSDLAEDIVRSQAPPVVKLWAGAIKRGGRPVPAATDVDELDYLEAGGRYVGA
jgi:hypothetical protein